MPIDPHRLFSVEEARRFARRRLPGVVFDYIDGAAGDEVTVRANRQAFHDLALRQATPRSAARPSIATTVLGTPVSSPVLLGPCGLVSLIHPGGAVPVGPGRGGAGHHLGPLHRGRHAARGRGRRRPGSQVVPGVRPRRRGRGVVAGRTGPVRRLRGVDDHGRHRRAGQAGAGPGPRHHHAAQGVAPPGRPPAVPGAGPAGLDRGHRPRRPGPPLRRHRTRCGRHRDRRRRLRRRARAPGHGRVTVLVVRRRRARATAGPATWSSRAS